MAAAIDFQGGPGTSELMDAVTILQGLNRTGGRKVPDHAPVGFVPARFAEYLTTAARADDDAAHRLCPRRRAQAGPLRRDQVKYLGCLDRARHEPGLDHDERGLRRPLRRAGLDRRVADAPPATSDHHDDLTKSY